MPVVRVDELLVQAASRGEGAQSDQARQRSAFKEAESIAMSQAEKKGQAQDP